MLRRAHQKAHGLVSLLQVELANGLQSNIEVKRIVRQRRKAVFQIETSGSVVQSDNFNRETACQFSNLLRLSKGIQKETLPQILTLKCGIYCQSPQMRYGDRVARQMFFTRQSIKVKRIQRERIIAADSRQISGLYSNKRPCDVFFCVLTCVFPQVHVHFRNAAVKYDPVVYRGERLNNPGMKQIKAQSDIPCQRADLVCIPPLRLSGPR